MFVKNVKLVIIGAVAVIGAIGIGITAAYFKNRVIVDTTPTTTQTNISTASIEPTIQEINYEYNYNLTTLLFLGIDDHQDTEATELIGNGGRADTIILFIYNEETHNLDTLEINRDIFTPVSVYDDDRNFLYNGDMQLCMQYSFSDNDTRGCLLMKSKISELLYETPINYYCSLNLDGMSAFINAIGGLTVTFDQDYTYINPSFEQGATVTMTAREAEHFYRYRDVNETGSNQDRMERQAWLMEQTFNTLTNSSEADVDAILEALDGYLTTDMSADFIYELRNATLGEIYTTPGEYQDGHVHDAFFMDDNALTELLFNLFYVEAES